MSIIVRGMEMPKNCALCKFRGAGETWCPFTFQEVPGNTIPEDCPLVPIPPHGRLIDLDALYRDAERRMREEESMSEPEISLHMDVLRFCFEKDGSRLYAPTVIESEETS